MLAGIDAARREGFPVKLNMVVLEDTRRSRDRAHAGASAGTRASKLQLINHFDIASAKSEQYLFDRPPKCTTCNKIRLLADGQLKPCLHSDQEIALDPADIEGSLRRTIEAKPENGCACTNRSMAQIGG